MKLVTSRVTSAAKMPSSLSKPLAGSFTTTLAFDAQGRGVPIGERNNYFHFVDPFWLLEQVDLPVSIEAFDRDRHCVLRAAGPAL
jgi:hypothetical protein